MPVAAQPVAAPPDASSPTTLAFLFTDIEGSSRLEQRLGTAAYGSLRARHRELLRHAFTAEDGQEQGTEGDSFFVVFPSSGAALRAAIAGQRALAAEPWPADGAVRVRMGIHTGEATTLDGDLVGIDINRAARIAATANGGQIVVSDATRSLVGDDLPPGTAIRDLGTHRIKDFDPHHLFDVVVEGLPAEFPPLRSGGSPFEGLPPQPTSFLGRSRELGDVRSALRQSRLVTLTGPGGTGKTRLAIAAAQSALGDFPGGVAWAGLSSIVDPDLVAPAIASALRVVDEGTTSLVDAIAARIGAERLLLVLDNFEQVADAASVVAALLAACPGLSVLVTSRGILHVAGEREYPVPPLPLPQAGDDPARLAENDAVALFVARARAVRPDFSLDASNAAAVAAICARLDGLPLAIELAAARVRLLTPSAIRERLERSLGLLTGGAQDLPDRQRTLRAAVAWSHDLLDPVSRTLFARLSVFAGGCSFEAAETVANPGGELGIDVLDGLAALVDQSLVRTADGVDGEPRYRMLNVIREFGQEQLGATGEMETLRNRHLAFFADLARAAEPELVGNETGRWLDRLETEHDNVRVALRWAIDSGQVETGLDMAGRLWRFWHQRAHLGEGLSTLRELLASPGADAPTAGRAKAVNGAGGLAYWQNDYPTARAFYEEHLSIVRALGDDTGTAEALMNLGFVHSVDGDYERAIAHYDESARLYRRSNHTGGEAAAMLGMGLALNLSGDNERALVAVRRSAEVAEQAGDRYRVASAIGVEGRIQRTLGNIAEGNRLARLGLTMFADVHDMTGMAMQVWDLGEGAVQEGRPVRALILAGASLAMRDRMAGGAPTSLSQTLNVLDAATPMLPPEEADAAIALGRSLDPDTAVEYAASDDERPGAAV